MQNLRKIVTVLQVCSLNMEVLSRSIKRGKLAFSVSTHGYQELVKSTEYDVTFLGPTFVKSSFLGKYTKTLNQLKRQLTITIKARSFDILYLSADEHYFIIYLLKWLGILRTPTLVVNHFTYDWRLVRGIVKPIFLRLERALLFNSVDCVLHTSTALRERLNSTSVLPKQHSEIAYWGASKKFKNEANKKLRPKLKSYIFAPGASNRHFQPLIDSCIILKQNLVILTTAEIEKTLIYDKFYVVVEKFETDDVLKFEKLWLHYLECIAVSVPIKTSNHVPNGASVISESIIAGKPLIVSKTDAKYIDIVKEGIGVSVSNNKMHNWMHAICELNDKFVNNKQVQKKLKLLANKYNYEKFSTILIQKFKALKYE